MTVDRYILFSVGEIRLKPLKFNTCDSRVIHFSKQNRVTDCVKCFLKINENATSRMTIISGISNILIHANQSMSCGKFASKAKLQII